MLHPLRITLVAAAVLSSTEAFSIPPLLSSRHALRRHASPPLSSTKMQAGVNKNNLEELINLASSTLASLARGPPGAFVSGYILSLLRLLRLLASPLPSLSFAPFSDFHESHPPSAPQVPRRAEQHLPEPHR